MRARAQPEHRSPRLPQPWLVRLWRAGLLGDGPASCWAFVWQASSDANSYDTLPINFPIPEFISDTNNI